MEFFCPGWHLVSCPAVDNAHFDIISTYSFCRPGGIHGHIPCADHGHFFAYFDGGGIFFPVGF